MTLRIWSPMVLAALALAGCAAGRGTYFLAEAQQHVRAAEEAGAPTRAVYAWTMADQYMRKAWEEWGNSAFEDSRARRPNGQTRPSRPPAPAAPSR